MTTYQRTNIYTVEDIRAIADNAGSYFFSKGAMRAFSSRLSADVYNVDGTEAVPGNRFYFVTSERFGDDEPRMYAVRLATLETRTQKYLDGLEIERPAIDISTVGERHKTSREAHREAQRLAEEARS